MHKEASLRRLDHLKDRVNRELIRYFGVSAKGPKFTAKFEEIFAEAKKDMEETEDGQERTSTPG
jgi:hypothetical protein